MTVLTPEAVKNVGSTFLSCDFFVSSGTGSTSNMSTENKRNDESRRNELINFRAETPLVERLDRLVDETGVESRSQLIRHYVRVGVNIEEEELEA